MRAAHEPDPDCVLDGKAMAADSGWGAPKANPQAPLMRIAGEKGGCLMTVIRMIGRCKSYC